METRSQERRRHPRHTPERDITGKVKSTMDFRVVDISEGGVLVETRLGLPPATVCELKVSGNGQELIFKAKVRRCRAQLTKTDSGCMVAYRTGLEFVKLDKESEYLLKQIIAENCSVEDPNEGPFAVNQGAVVSGSLYTV